MLADREAVGHAGDVIGRLAPQPHARATRRIGHLRRLGTVSRIQLADDLAAAAGGFEHLQMTVEVAKQEALEQRGLLAHGR